MTKIKHRATGTILEVPHAVVVGTWIDVYDTEGDKAFSATFRGDSWEILPPTNEEIITGLEIGSTFHFEYGASTPSAGYVKSYNNTVINYAGSKVNAADFNGNTAKLVVDFTYEKEEG